MLHGNQMHFVYFLSQRQKATNKMEEMEKKNESPV